MLEKMAADKETILLNKVSVNPIVGSTNPPLVAKKKRSLPGNPDPEAEVIALSPKSLMATNRFLCEVCGKGFQRDQNLQLHRRGHNLPWKLKQRSSNCKEARKRVYVCPERACVHHNPTRALGDLTGIKKHFCRKHGDKKWKCEKCSKKYAVKSDWKAHSKTCGTKEYKCDCGTLFSRRDSFITHRAFCDALAEETARINNNINYHFTGSTILSPNSTMVSQPFSMFKPMINNGGNSILGPTRHELSLWNMQQGQATQSIFGDPNIVLCPNEDQYYQSNRVFGAKNANQEPITSTVTSPSPSSYNTQQQQHQTNQTSSASMSATALLQKAAGIGSTDPSTNSSNDQYCGLYVSNNSNPMVPISDVLDDHYGYGLSQLQMYPPVKRRRNDHDQESVGLGQTRDFLGVGGQQFFHPSPNPINGWI